MEGGRAGPQGDRLHADLRAARDRARRRHAAGGHPRRRRPDGSDPGRRLLPELHLPHPALDPRARAHRAPGLPGRHAVSVDLRRDPQPLGHVADPVQGQVRALLRRAAELRGRRSAASTTCTNCRCCATTSASSPASRSPTTRCAPRSPSTTRTAAPCANCTRSARKNPGRRRPPRSTWSRAPACCCRPRSTRSWCATTSPRPTPRSARSATTPASSSPARSASSRRWG